MLKNLNPKKSTLLIRKIDLKLYKQDFKNTFSMCFT